MLVCKLSSPHKNDFAISIKIDDEPTSFTLVGNEADRVREISA